MSLNDLFHEDAYAREEAARARLRDLYREDLRATLQSPEGRRVLFHWLDAARPFGLICGSGGGGAEEVLKAAAVSDYGRARLMEIHAADPQGFLHIMTAGFQSNTGAAQEEKHG